MVVVYYTWYSSKLLKYLINSKTSTIELLIFNAIGSLNSRNRLWHLIAILFQIAKVTQSASCISYTGNWDRESDDKISLDSSMYSCDHLRIQLTLLDDLICDLGRQHRNENKTSSSPIFKKFLKSRAHFFFLLLFRWPWHERIDFEYAIDHIDNVCSALTFWPRLYISYLLESENDMSPRECPFPLGPLNIQISKENRKYARVRII